MAVEKISDPNPKPVPEPQLELKQTPKKKGLPHAFVVMPFGTKTRPIDGRSIDFNSIYRDLN